MAPPDFVPPTEAKETGDGVRRRRGVLLFASKDIHKGAMIYGKTTNYAYFSSGYSFQRFLEDLSDGEACDFMKFAWPQSGFGPNGESAIVAVMDYHSFMNDGVKATTNCGCIAGKDCMVSWHILLFCIAQISSTPYF